MPGNTVKIAPSILSADFGQLLAQVQMVEAAGADYIHVDVMDGHFVPNLTIGPVVCEALKDRARLPLDVHLMIEQPDTYAPEFVKAGASIVTIHAEATRDLHRSVHLIKSLGVKAGVALNPASPLLLIEPVLKNVDLVLLMTVNPGFGGQNFIAEVLEKIRQLDETRQRLGLNFEIEVDGGINAETAAAVCAAGARVLVAGHAIFRTPDPAEALRGIRRAAETAIQG